METDVLLVANVFEQFRKTCLKHYGFNPCQYFTSLGLSWDVLLQNSQFKLELQMDYDQYLFVKRGIRCGFSSIGFKWYAKANNPEASGTTRIIPRHSFIT